MRVLRIAALAWVTRGGAALAATTLTAATLAATTLTGCADRYDHTRFPPEHASCTMEVAVTNMACPDRCPTTVWHALKTIRGVGDVEVSYESRRAIVYAAWPACSHDGMEDILVTLESRGYKGAIVRSD